MICNHCGTEVDIGTKFCPECGTPVAKVIVPATVSSSSQQVKQTSTRRTVIAAALLLAAIIVVVTIIVETSASSDKGSAVNNTDTSTGATLPHADVEAPPPAPSKPQAPPFTGQTLHPYDLLKNPYQSRGKLIGFNLNSLPVLYNGAVIQYSGPMDPTMGTRLGLMALRLERMTDENVALYNIMGIEAGGSNGQILGQIAVDLPEGMTELKFDRAWMVEPLEPLKGTNYLGAAIQIPSVRFWRYVGEKDESTDNRSAAIAPSKGFRYVKYPHGYMVDEFCSAKQQAGTDSLCYPFNWQPWIKQREQETAGDQADALKADTGTTGAGNLVISWDSEQRVVFYGFRPHDSMSGSAYFIVAPTRQEIDIIWQRGDNITYLGPDASLLRSVHAYEWLKQVGF